MLGGQPGTDILDAGLPAFLQIEITSHCNLRCFMCPLTDGLTTSSGSRGHMPAAIWERRILPMARRVRHVLIAGFGEPLAHPDCLGLLGQLNRHRVSTHLVTNGTLLTPRKSADLARIRHLFQINVSLDAADAETYRSIRGGDHARALDGLANLASAVADPARVTASCVVTARNLRTIAALPALLEARGVRTLIVQSLVSYSPRMATDLVCGDGSFGQHLASLKSAASRHRVSLVFQQPARIEFEAHHPAEASRADLLTLPAGGGETRQCALPWEAPFVDKDGRVFSCCLASAHPAAQMGDLRHETFEAVWEGRGFRALRASLLSGDQLPEACRKCTAVPVGKHPFLANAATVRARESVLSGRKGLRVVVQNTGTSTWARSDRFVLGSARPRNRPSALQAPGWLAPNRIVSFREKEVPPRGTATFVFQVRPSGVAEDFEIVKEDVCWLPQTRVSLGPAHWWNRSLLRMLRETRYRLADLRHWWAHRRRALERRKARESHRRHHS